MLRDYRVMNCPECTFMFIKSAPVEKVITKLQSSRGSKKIWLVGWNPVQRGWIDTTSRLKINRPLVSSRRWRACRSWSTWDLGERYILRLEWRNGRQHKQIGWKADEESVNQSQNVPSFFLLYCRHKSKDFFLSSSQGWSWFRTRWLIFLPWIHIGSDWSLTML